MIPANELRIGNWIADSGGKFWQIDHWEYWNKVSAKSERIGGGIIPMMTHPYTEHVEQLSPIPITPEWLERLGFELHKPCGDEGFIKWKHKNGVYLLWIEGKFWHDHWSTGIWINSVHQLQNLYHALTGQELTVKELTPSIS